MIPTLRHMGGSVTKVNVTSDLTLYFSYETCVGFWLVGEKLTFTDRHYSQTTERHKTEIATREGVSTSIRIPAEEFEAKLISAMAGR